MLATPAREVPGDEDDWAAEAKWDGARAIAYVSGGEAAIHNRAGQDVTSSYPELAADLVLAAGRRSLILDGEVTVFAADRPSFALLQRRLHVTRPAPALLTAVPVTFVAFDLLYQAGRPLLRNPYAQRRALLDALGLAAPHIAVPPAFPGQASALTAASRDLGLEGVVLKRLASRYHPGQRTSDWLKIRHLTTADVVIGAGLGMAVRPRRVGPGRPAGPGRARLSRHRGLGVHRGRAPRPDRAAPRPRAARLAVRRTRAARRAHWTHPVLAAEVTYTGITPAGRMRHPVWRGLRPA